MARISGIDLPNQKRIEVALTYIYGIGRKTASKICKECKVDPGTKSMELTDGQIGDLRSYIENNLAVEGDLRSQVRLSIKRLLDLNTYRGLRHKRNLPVRGQRTHTNARTRKGPRSVAVALVKKTV